MGLGKKIKIRFLASNLRPRYQKIVDSENKISSMHDTIKFTESSPKRFDIPLEALSYMERGFKPSFFNKKVLPYAIGSMRGIGKSFNSIKKNPLDPKTNCDPEFIKSFEEYCYRIGASVIGYTKMPPEFLFKDKGVIFDNAIVFAMEMDKDNIAKAPSLDTLIEVQKTYRDLGKVVNSAAEFLREHGYAAQASHPLGGVVLYPRLARLANLGWQGRHGMLITPQFGPRVRLAAVFTSISNLLITNNNPHSWIESYCKTCDICIKTCPVNAIYTDPIKKDNGIITHIDVNKCFPYFLENHGCSVCMDRCQFNRIGYEKLKEITQNRSVDL